MSWILANLVNLARERAIRDEYEAPALGTHGIQMKTQGAYPLPLRRFEVLCARSLRC